MNKIYIRFPITRDLVNTYRIYRRCGDTRDKAIARLRMEYKQELADCDDGPVVRIGIALALCQKDELTQSVLEEALVAIDKLLVEQWDGNMRSTFHELEVYIHDPQRLGDEAKIPCSEALHPPMGGWRHFRAYVDSLYGEICWCLWLECYFSEGG